MKQTMKKPIPQKTLRRMAELQEMHNALTEKYKKNIYELQQKYNISDSHFDYKFEKWKENDHNFADAAEELYAEYEKPLQIILAKWAARFLIVTNIARKGKLLHPDTAVRKLKKYGDNGKYVIDMIKKPVFPIVFNSEPYLARELYNSFHVTLMDTSLLQHLLTKIRNIEHIFPDDDEYRKKQIQHYKNFIKKFHKSVIEYQKNTLSHEPF